MTFVVVVADRIAESGFRLLRGTPGLEVVPVIGDPAALRRALPRAHALLVRSDTEVTAELIELGPSLRVIGRAGIGVDNIDVPAATRRGIAVLNAPGGNTVSAAEHTFAVLLSLVRRIPWAVQSMRTGAWDRKAFSGTELRGKELGVIGLGRIGAHVSAIAKAFGMKVVAHDPYLTEQRARDLAIELLDLDELLARADVVTLHLPLSDTTRHLLDAPRLAGMKPTAVLVNTARGELVDEAALLDAVESRRIAGAALDVFSEEPLPADSPLRKSDRIILTPHLAASTAEAQERVALEICTAVRDALLGGDVAGAVNVPGVSAEAMRRVRPLLDVARRLGRLATTLAGGRVHAVEVAYGGTDQDAPRPAELAAAEGALAAMGVGPVSLVNAQPLAQERGIVLSRRVGPPIAGFETTVAVTVRAGGRSAVVIGALVGDRGRIVRIDGFTVDVPAEGYLIVLRNRDVPGVIGRVGTMLGESGVNIASWHQGRDAREGEALAAITVDQPPVDEVRARLEKLP
ncbi:MAG TPA: phosphoglycerate dehydrogenase, partial [Gemmatimonadales bacterium]|nr:phosphoglycerate dehydrogenase [Gemmatimonadales bacterium]